MLSVIATGPYWLRPSHLRLLRRQGHQENDGEALQAFLHRRSTRYCLISITSSVAVSSLKNLELCDRCSHENEAPPALNATLDGSTCPWWKMGLFGRLKRFFYRKRNKLNRGQVLSPKCLLLSPIDLGTSVYFALTLSQSYAVGSLPIIFLVCIFYCWAKRLARVSQCVYFGSKKYKGQCKVLSICKSKLIYLILVTKLFTSSHFYISFTKFIGASS